MQRFLLSALIGLGLVACGPKKPSADASAATKQGESAPAPLPNAPLKIEGGSPPSCANVRCAAGTHCELAQVQCVAAPCHPVPECKPDAGVSDHVSCGKSTCSLGQVCCNASCGICTDPGHVCIQMVCQ